LEFLCETIVPREQRKSKVGKDEIFAVKQGRGHDIDLRVDKNACCGIMYKYLCRHEGSKTEDHLKTEVTIWLNKTPLLQRPEKNAGGGGGVRCGG